MANGPSFLSLECIHLANSLVPASWIGFLSWRSITPNVMGNFTWISLGRESLKIWGLLCWRSLTELNLKHVTYFHGERK